MENEIARKLSKILGVQVNQKFRYRYDTCVYVLTENGKIYSILSGKVNQINANTLANFIAYPQGILLMNKEKPGDEVYVPCILKYPYSGEYFISEEKHYDRIIGILQNKSFLAKDAEGHIYRLQRPSQEKTYSEEYQLSGHSVFLQI